MESEVVSWITSSVNEITRILLLWVGIYLEHAGCCRWTLICKRFTGYKENWQDGPITTVSKNSKSDSEEKTVNFPYKNLFL